MNDEQKKTENTAQINRKVHQLVARIDSDPHNPENYLKLATLLLEEGSFDQASQLLERAKQLVPHPQDLDYDLAVCYYMQGNFEKSLALLEQIPNDDLVLYQKALVFFKIGQSQKSLAYALTIKRVDNKVHELLGDIWLSLGELKQAAASYQSIAPGQRSAKVNFMLGISTLTSDRDQALDYLHQSQDQDADYYQQAKQQYAAVLKLVSDKGKDND